MAFVGSDISGLPSIKTCGWSYFKQLCAVIPSDNTVHIYNEKGNETEYPTISRNARATTVEWCRSVDLLAIGWNDGGVSVWKDGQITELKPMKAGVNLVCWHPILPCLLAADESGNVIAWDLTATPVPMFAGSADAQFTIAVWCPKEIPFAFLASSEGGLFTFENNTSGNLNEICNCPKPIHILTIAPTVNRLIIISGDNIISQYNLPPTVAKHSQTKLPVGDVPKLIRIRGDTICYAIANAISIYDINADETLILRTPSMQTVSSLHFDTILATLYAVTYEGQILEYRATMKNINRKEGWSAPRVIEIGAKVDTAYWSTACCAFVALCSGRRPHIFRRHVIQCLETKEFTLYQKDPRTVAMLNGNTIKSNSVIENIHASNSHILVATDTSSTIYTIRNDQMIPFTDTFTTDTPLVTILGENTYEVKGQALKVRNLQGVVKQTVTIGTNSFATHFAANGNFICVLDNDMNVYLYDISRRQPKLQFTTVFQTTYEMFRIRSVSLSCGGFCISIGIDYYNDGWLPAPSLYLHSPQFDKTVAIPFDDRAPMEHYWDAEDPRLLCIQSSPYSTQLESKMTGTTITPLFVADSLDVFRQTVLNVDSGIHLMYLDIPKVMVSDYVNEPAFHTLPQFEGLETADEESKKALMELNFHLATSDIDAAFNAIRGINNKSTWRSLAQTCAQMRRIDLADLCFGRMEDGGSALLLHKARNAGDIDAIVCVDEQLGLYDQAKSVALDNRRFDLLADVHRSLNEWKDSTNICSASDRIHYKAMCHEYGRSLEIRGELEEAIKQYEMAGTIAEELPRLAMQADDLKILFNYVAGRPMADIPKKLLLWVARFFEAHNQMKSAEEYYKNAGSTQNVVRLLCIQGKWDDAQKLVQRTSQRSVICEYARLLIKRIEYLAEKGDDTSKLRREVVEQFRRARQFGQAMEFALQQQAVDDILSLSFSAPRAQTCKAAMWFERQKEYKNAILLYSRAGHLNRALTLCFKMKQYDALDEISDSLNMKTDPEVLIRCGQYFVDSERWSKAAQCYVLAKQFDIVIDLCNKHNIKLSSNVIQELAQDNSEPELLKRFAALCEQQREFNIAAQLYLKLKEYLSAIKALIRAGDTQKVIKFAKLMKKKESYILAANYMQTLNPRDNKEIFDTIVDFYNRAGSPDKLARFYESAAQVEIDEYQSYQRGLDLIKLSIEVLQETQGLKNRDAIIKNMEMRVRLISLYLQATKLVQSEPKKAIAICVELLRTKEIETCLRSDDVYILMVQCYATQGNFKNAYKLLEDLRSSGTDLTWFMDVAEIDRIYKAAGQVYDGPRGDKNEEDYDSIDDAEIEDIE